MKHFFHWTALTVSILCVQLAAAGFVISGYIVYLLAVVLGCFCLAGSICQLIAYRDMRKPDPPEQHYHFYVNETADVSNQLTSSPWIRRW